MRRLDDSPNWGGSRPNSGAKRQSVKLSVSELARLIYMQSHYESNSPHAQVSEYLYGDKTEHDNEIGEISDWLHDYPIPARVTLKQIRELAAEWREYNAI